MTMTVREKIPIKASFCLSGILAFLSNNAGIVITSIVSPAYECPASRLTHCVCDNIDGALVDESCMLKCQRWLLVTLRCRLVSHEIFKDAKSALLKMYSKGLSMHLHAIDPIRVIQAAILKSRTTHHQVRWPWTLAPNLRKKKRNESLTVKRQG